MKPALRNHTISDQCCFLKFLDSWETNKTSQLKERVALFLPGLLRPSLLGIKGNPHRVMRVMIRNPNQSQKPKIEDGLRLSSPNRKRKMALRMILFILNMIPLRMRMMMMMIMNRKVWNVEVRSRRKKSQDQPNDQRRQSQHQRDQLLELVTPPKRQPSTLHFVNSIVKKQIYP